GSAPSTRGATGPRSSGGPSSTTYDRASTPTSATTTTSPSATWRASARSELAGGAVPAPPPLRQSRNGAPHPSPGATTLRVSAPDPIAGRWDPVDQRHRYAM